MMEAPSKLPGAGPSPGLHSLERSSAELQQLWFACLRRRWSSLVIVPAHPEASAYLLAEQLTATGAANRDRPVRLIDARGMTVASSRAIELASRSAAGELTLVCVDSVLTSQAAIPLSLAVDAALLYVELGRAELDLARRTLQIIGEDRFVGAVAVHPPGAGR